MTGYVGKVDAELVAALRSSNEERHTPRHENPMNLIAAVQYRPNMLANWGPNQRGGELAVIERDRCNDPVFR
ncbi:hypothetical protein M378DRAFT_171506 [Amanita muscaria Koide BX008]|uniref:Uncharacterized protein n=1 Tax=Amanita muscaria (strain Koide BX008) TaxID=946122 RepID=A0A0C2WN48_AMAMK|nr:hypothetical protein M378DRAFT_171506 [Amanita muscaria Koide BX008]